MMNPLSPTVTAMWCVRPPNSISKTGRPGDQCARAGHRGPGGLACPAEEGADVAQEAAIGLFGRAPGKQALGRGGVVGLADRGDFAGVGGQRRTHGTQVLADRGGHRGDRRGRREQLCGLGAP
jgi:hypothetical protein